MKPPARPRVLLLWHAGMLPGYLAMFEALGKRIELMLVCPRHWTVAGKQYRAPLSAKNFTLAAIQPRFQSRESTLWYPGLKELIHRFQPDLVHLKEEPTHGVCLQAAWAARCMPRPPKLIFETLQNQAVSPSFPWSWVQARSFKNSAAAVVITNEIASVLKGFGYTKPIVVLPLWVDTDCFKAGSKIAARKKLKLDHRPLLGYVGRLAQEKGLDVFLETLSQLPSRWKALWVGEGPYRSVLQKQILSKGLQKRVSILGAMDQTQLVHAYRAMDCLALPSRTTPWWKEQFGRVLVEAMACGTPCVGSNSGAIAEVMGRGGRAVPEGDAAALAKAVLAVSGKNHASASARAKKQAGRYSARQVALGHVKFYLSLLGNGS